VRHYPSGHRGDATNRLARRFDTAAGLTSAVDALPVWAGALNRGQFDPFAVITLPVFAPPPWKPLPVWPIEVIANAGLANRSDATTRRPIVVMPLPV